MSKHTKGPWTVAQGDGCFVVETDDSAVRFRVEGLDMAGDQANARLIAAAPDLLSTLQSMVVSFAPPDYELEGTSNKYLMQHFPEWFKARAAIAKATGQ